MWGAGVMDSTQAVSAPGIRPPFALLAIGLVVLICVIMTISAFAIAVGGEY